jgi:hypothetical protein
VCVSHADHWTKGNSQAEIAKEIGNEYVPGRRFPLAMYFHISSAPWYFTVRFVRLGSLFDLDSK